MNNLFTRSIEIILQNQSDSGAYIASPNFPNYRYCWFRDGAFTAYAMGLVGEHKSAARFHSWVAGVVNQRKSLIENTTRKASRGEPVGAEDILDTRYTLDGKPAEEDWPNFQLDGFGTWLWALVQHKRLSGDQLPTEWLSAARLVADYLASLWSLPCYDCWEEFPEEMHPHTLATISAGLRAFATLTTGEYTNTMTEISSFIITNGVSNGHFSKFIGSDAIDASLIGLAVPYQVISTRDPLMLATIEEIETTRRTGGGLRRYPTDTYYGGGEWILLTAWLGWYYAETGEWEKAKAALQWVEAQADQNGNLPEQILSSQTDPGHYREWRQRWGEIANPLLWSHAKYIILFKALENSHT